MLKLGSAELYAPKTVLTRLGSLSSLPHNQGSDSLGLRGQKLHKDVTIWVVNLPMLQMSFTCPGICGDCSIVCSVLYSTCTMWWLCDEAWGLFMYLGKSECQVV